MTSNRIFISGASRFRGATVISSTTALLMSLLITASMVNMFLIHDVDRPRPAPVAETAGGSYLSTTMPPRRHHSLRTAKSGSATARMPRLIYGALR